MNFSDLHNKMHKPKPNQLVSELYKLNPNDDDDKSRLVSVIISSAYLQENNDIAERFLEEIKKINANEPFDALFLFKCIERIVYTIRRESIEDRIQKGRMTKLAKTDKELKILLRYLYKVDCYSTLRNNEKLTVKQAIDYVWEKDGEKIKRRMEKIKSNYGKGQFAARFNGYYLDYSKKKNNYETPCGRKLKKYNKKRIRCIPWVPNAKSETE